MAISNDVTRYKFFGSCGTQAEISNDGTTAQRRKPQSEFNDAVLIGSEPLVDGVLFQVRIDKKVTSWTGSIMIGENYIRLGMLLTNILQHWYIWQALPLRLQSVSSFPQLSARWLKAVGY